MTNDRNFRYRTRRNVAAISGLASSIMSHAARIEMLAKNGGVDAETKLQSLLANLVSDVETIESVIVEEEQ